MLRLWLGEWRKNDSQYWHFIPEPNDTGITLYMEGGESLATVEGVVRGHYGVCESKPMVITYGLPDWMVAPSGHTPPLTIGSTSELLQLMTSRPWMVEFTFYVTMGAKGVARYHFNRRSPFYIGSTSFIVDDTQNACAKAAYEKLVFGKRKIASEEVMNEIFGDQEMALFHRVAMEMEHADKEKNSDKYELGGPGTEIIRLDDDSEMEDASRVVVRMDSTRGVIQRGEGSVDKGKGISLDSVVQNKGPAVLWDVGVDFLGYTEISLRERAAALEASENAFWEGVLHEQTMSTCESTDSDEDNAVLTGITKTIPLTKEGGVALVDADGSSSTNNTAVNHAQSVAKNTSACMEAGVVIRAALGIGRVTVVPMENPGGVTAEEKTTKGDNTSAGSQGPPPEALTLTLACGGGGPSVETIPTKTNEGSASATDKDGGNTNVLSPRVLKIVTRNFEMTGGYGVNIIVLEAYNVSMLRGAYQEMIIPVGDYKGFPVNDAIFNGRRLSPPATRRPRKAKETKVLLAWGKTDEKHP
ncbi:hypothetical protein Bca4012_028030 [Brassica carinata]